MPWQAQRGRHRENKETLLVPCFVLLISMISIVQYSCGGSGKRERDQLCENLQNFEYLSVVIGSSFTMTDCEQRCAFVRSSFD
jgi:hypothetical protein